MYHSSVIIPNTPIYNPSRKTIWHFRLPLFPGILNKPMPFLYEKIFDYSS